MAQREDSHESHHSSYVDGIKVKISEQFKPPPKIILPISYAQKQSINEQIQRNMPGYDFNLERSVKSRLNDWKIARKLIAEDRKTRLEKVQVEIANIDCKVKSKEVENSNNIEESSSNSNTNTASYNTSGILIPTQINSYNSSILLPTKQIINRTTTVDMDGKSTFNLADFEADTSSPFDNMELKTINDLAELALVLNKEKSTNTKSNSNYNNYDSPLATTTTTTATNNANPTSQLNNGYYYNNHYQYSYPQAQTQTSVTTVTKNQIQSAMQAMQQDLDNNHRAVRVTTTAATATTVVKTEMDVGRPPPSRGRQDKEELLGNPYESLTLGEQATCKSISGMGFPLERVARACKVLNNDDKKIVEYLLAMSDLMDLGFSESRVSQSLLKCDHDKDKALEDLLISCS